MSNSRSPLISRLILLLSLTGYSVCQSAPAETPSKDSPCVVDISRFAGTSQGSSEAVESESSLLDPNTPVTQQLIVRLGESDRRNAGTGNLYSFTGKYLDLLLQALPQKRGQAQLESFETLVDGQFMRSKPLPPELQGCLQSEAASIFPSLPFDSQRIILQRDDYGLFKSAELTFYLRQLYESLDDPAGKLDPGEPERFLRFYRGIVLRRIYDQDPITGKAMILDEIASGKPRVDMDSLGILPDATLPEIDQIIRKQLLTLRPDSGDETMAELGVLERYASENILASVKSSYGRDCGKWSADQNARFLSYFLRTDLEFARRQIASCVKQRPEECGSVFTDIAHVRVSAELGSVAKDYIEYGDRKIAANAAYIFKW